MVEIPNGAVAGYVGQWDIPYGNLDLSNTSQIYALVGQELIGDGLTIVSSSTGSFAEQTYFALGGNMPARMQILNQSGQELDDSDLTSQIADAVRVVGGTVVSGAVTDVTGPASGTNTGTVRTPAGASTGAGAGGTSTQPSASRVCGDPSWGFFDDPATWLQCLTTKGLTTVGLLAIGLLIGLVLLFATPQGAAVRRA